MSKKDKEKINEAEKIKIIDNIIKNEYNNRELTNTITQVFARKGLSGKFIEGLFSEDIEFDKLGDIILQIAFIEGCHEYFKEKKLELQHSLDPIKWFNNNELMEYKTYMNTTEVRNTLEFKNGIKIDDKNYVFYVPIEDIYDFIKNGLLPYKFETQREGKYKKIGNRVTRVISLNPKSVQEIAQLVKEGKYEEDMIILNALITNDNHIDYEEEKVGNAYNLTIRPNYDITSPNYTIVNPIDGYHRIMGYFTAQSELISEGKQVNAGLIAKVVFRTVEGARRIVDMSFKRTDTNKDYRKAIEDNDYNKFISELENECKFLKGKVATTYNEYKAFDGMLTHSAVLRDTLEKCMDINVSDIGESARAIASVTETFDMLFENLIKKYENINNLIDTRLLVDVNIFAGYLAIANILIKESKVKKFLALEKIVEKLCSLTREDLNNLDLSKPKANIMPIYEYFSNLTKEVLSNE